MLGDCLERMAEIPDGSVDAVVTDPPYGITNEDYESEIAFNDDLWRECFRVCKSDATLISFSASRTYHRIAMAAELGGWYVRQMWGWIYRDGLITSAWPKDGFDRLAPAMDPILYATKGKVILNLRREGDAWDRYTGQTHLRSRFTLSTRSGKKGKQAADGHWPRSIVADSGVSDFEYFAMSRTNGGQAAKTGHPNTKPLPLMEWLVDKLPVGSTVLDMFAGSGTTGVACINTGRSFIGIERDASYFAIAERRIADAGQAQPLFPQT
jgi:site-specific DNA-methyltransferase (adenine-specific)